MENARLMAAINNAAVPRPAANSECKSGCWMPHPVHPRTCVNVPRACGAFWRLQGPQSGSQLRIGFARGISNSGPSISGKSSGLVPSIIPHVRTRFIANGTEYCRVMNFPGDGSVVISSTAAVKHCEQPSDDLLRLVNDVLSGQPAWPSEADCCQPLTGAFIQGCYTWAL